MESGFAAYYAFISNEVFDVYIRFDVYVSFDINVNFDVYVDFDVYVNFAIISFSWYKAYEDLCRSEVYVKIDVYVRNDANVKNDANINFDININFDSNNKNVICSEIYVFKCIVLYPRKHFNAQEHSFFSTSTPTGRPACYDM